jgi:hypothetical protein
MDNGEIDRLLASRTTSKILRSLFDGYLRRSLQKDRA